MGRHREVATAVVVDTAGRLLLQLRDNIAGVLCPGMIGLFGGHREGNESFLECVVRELHEELGCLIPSSRFEHLCRYEGADYAITGGSLLAEFYVVRGVSIEGIEVTEGTLKMIELNRLVEIECKLTPSARLATSVYVCQSLTYRR